MEERLKKLLEVENLTQAQLAKILDVERGTINHILAGRNKPRYDLIVKILQAFPYLSPDWLLLGKGKMYRENHPTSPEKQPTIFDAKNTDEEKSTEKKEIENQQKEIKEENKKEKEEKKEAEPEDNCKNENIKDEKEKPKEEKSEEKEEKKSYQPEQIIIFYEDKTFELFTPRKK